MTSLRPHWKWWSIRDIVVKEWSTLGSMDREFWSKAHRCSSPRSTCGPSRATCLTLGWFPSTSWLGYQRFLESQEGFLHGLHVRSDHKERETGGHQEQLWNEGLSHLDCKPCSCKEGFWRTQTPRSLQWSCCLLPWSQFNYWNGRRRADIEPSRPITVLSVLYRWWSRVTRCYMWLFACSQCTQASVRDRIGLKGIGFTESFPNGPTFQPFSS